MLKTPEAPTRADFHAAIAARGDRWFAVCLRITRDRDLAEDAVQDALLSAWNKRDQFDRSARLDTWIHTPRQFRSTRGRHRRHERHAGEPQRRR
ncbi:MAG: sigma factor [Woeseiaceae bacterium]